MIAPDNLDLDRTLLWAARCAASYLELILSVRLIAGFISYRLRVAVE